MSSDHDTEEYKEFKRQEERKSQLRATSNDEG